MSIYSAYLGDFLSYQGQNTICSTRYINQVLLFLEIIIAINILKKFNICYFIYRKGLLA